MSRTRRSKGQRGKPSMAPEGEASGASIRTTRGDWLQSEDDLLRSIVQLAKVTGWKVYHQRPGYSKSGRVATQLMGHPGFPDLVLVRGGRFLVAELKSSRGSTRPEQREWLSALREAGVETHVWRPRDWDDIEDILKGVA